MNYLKKTTAILLIAILSSTTLLLSGCADKQAKSDKFNCSDNKIQIVATLSNWGSVAEKVGGECVEVKNIISGSGVEPHDFEVTPSDITTLENADIILANGATYDAWVDAISESESFDGVLISAEDVAEKNNIILDEDLKTGEISNPHLWFNIDIYEFIALDIYNAINEKLDANQWSKTESSYNEFLQRNNELKDLVEEFKSKNLTNSFAYGATESLIDYLMDELAFVDLTPESFKDVEEDEGEVSAKAITDFEKIIAKNSISTLVVNETEITDVTEKLIENATNKKVYTLNVTEMLPTDREDLIDWISSLINEISKNASPIEH